MPLQRGDSPLNTTLGKFVANIGYGGIRGGVLLANTLVLTPILISRLGRDQFAILALVTPFLRYGFNGVFDLGLATGLVRFLSRDFASGDHASINRYCTSSFWLYVTAGASLLVLYQLASPSLLHSLLGLDVRLYVTAQTALRQFLWIYAILLLSNPFFALLMGVQKVHLSHVVGTVSLLIELIGILVLVPLGITLSRVVFVYAVGAIVCALLCVILAYYHFPHLRLRLQSVSGRSILDLAHYTTRWSVTVSTSLLAPVIDKLILARFVGLSYVAIYEAAAKLIEILKRATQLLLLPIFPLAGAALANQTKEQRQAFYQRVFGANLVLSAGLYLIPMTVIFGIMRIWLGPELSGPAGWAFVVLSSTGFMLALVTPAALILAGTGRMRLLVTTGLTALSLNLFLSSILAKHLGFRGLLAGTALAYVGQSLLILVGLQRWKEFTLNVRSFIRMGLVVVCGAVVPGLVLVAIFGREPGAAKLVALGAAEIAIYCAALFTFEDNRKLAVIVTMHGRKIVGAWLVGRRTGQISQG